MIGSTISHYKIFEKIGEGGMGVVYKAEDMRLKRIVALKFLPHNLTATPEDRARFQHEAQAAATLNHPNICTIHAIDEYEGQQFIEMEFLDGSTLRDKPAPVAPAEAAGIVLQIAEGLSAAHAKGIIHRDIKSENIMLTRDLRVKIMDFGLARLRGNLRLTRAGATIGTIAYMSPEQIQDGDVDERSASSSTSSLPASLLLAVSTRPRRSTVSSISTRLLSYRAKEKSRKGLVSLCGRCFRKNAISVPGRAKRSSRH
jgi:serine/threonine protein kinase